MFITELSIKRPTVSWVMSLILIVFGLFVFWKLPVRELPNGIQPPVVQIQVDYKSAAASIVDQEVTQVVEDVIGGAEGIKNLDEILSVEGFDILFIGPYDLSQSIGKPGQVESPEVMILMQEIAKKCLEKNIILGSFSDTINRNKTLKEEGFHYIAYSVDVNIYLKACQEIVRGS